MDHEDDNESYSVGDNQVNWDSVERLEDQITTIQAISNPVSKAKAVKAWQEALSG